MSAAYRSMAVVGRRGRTDGRKCYSRSPSCLGTRSGEVIRRGSWRRTVPERVASRSRTRTPHPAARMGLVLPAAIRSVQPTRISLTPNSLQHLHRSQPGIRRSSVIAGSQQLARRVIWLSLIGSTFASARVLPRERLVAHRLGSAGRRSECVGLDVPWMRVHDSSSVGRPRSRTREAPRVGEGCSQSLRTDDRCRPPVAVSRYCGRDSPEVVVTEAMTELAKRSPSAPRTLPSASL